MQALLSVLSGKCRFRLGSWPDTYIPGQDERLPMNGYLQFLDPRQDTSIAYLSTYNVPMVSLSILMAIIASFVALQLSDRIQRTSANSGKVMWLIAGSLAMGGGVWAMHFIGMLAFNLPCGISYDPKQTIASMLPGMLAGAAALWTISRPSILLRHMVLGGVLMGGGIGAMHYSGMAAMRLDGVIYYSPVLFGVSIAVAMALAIFSLYVKFLTQSHDEHKPEWINSILGALIMGIAISGMHYVAMEAAYFLPINSTPTDHGGVSPTVLAVGVTTAVTVLMLITFAATVRARLIETIQALKSAVTIREHAEKELSDRLTELKFQKFALDEHAIVSITDVKGNITYANDKFCDISGYPREELIGQNHHLLKSTEHSPEFYKNLWQTIANGQPWHGEIKNFKKGGGEYWVKATIVPFLDLKGKPFQYVAIRTDITERKEVEREAQEAREQAEIANEAKSQFLANMSHELRTPLNAILGFSEMMKMQVFGPLGSDQYLEYANDIYASGSHLLSIVDDILHMSKIEAGTHNLNIISIDVPTLVQECLSIIRGRASELEISIINKAADPLPPLVADQLAVKQCLINLLSNAIKFTPRMGTVTVSADATHNWYDLVVSDTGIGVAKKDIPKLTQPFTQIERNDTAKIHEGTGIGLTITKNLIEMHGGTLEIESELNVGTTVTIHLPRGAATDNEG